MNKSSQHLFALHSVVRVSYQCVSQLTLLHFTAKHWEHAHDPVCINQDLGAMQFALLTCRSIQHRNTWDVVTESNCNNWSGGFLKVICFLITIGKHYVYFRRTVRSLYTSWKHSGRQQVFFLQWCKSSFCKGCAVGTQKLRLDSFVKAQYVLTF